MLSESSTTCMARGRKRRREETGSAPTKSAFRTIKLPLKSIVRDKITIERINEIVFHCNDIVTEAYQFIRLFCLTKYEKNEPIPELDEKFILYCLRATGSVDSRGRPKKDPGLVVELNAFYTQEFKPLLSHEEKFDMRYYSHLLSYLATQMHTAIHNNLKEHFVTRLLRFINKTAPAYEECLDKVATRKTRRDLKNAIFKNDKSLVPERYAEWHEKHREHIAPGEWKESLAYDAKANPQRYLFSSFYMNDVLEDMKCKLFQPLSLRTSIVPHHITFDTSAIMNFFAEKRGKADLLKNQAEKRKEFWNKFFNLDKPVFRQKGYDFNFLLQTDGVGVSLLFVHKDYMGDKKCLNTITGVRSDPPLIDTFDSDGCESLKDREVVGVDPGKFNIVYMIDGKKNKLRYTAFQRRTETLLKRNQRILLTEKGKLRITESETELSEYNSKTVNVDKFKEYVKAKNKVNKECGTFYRKALHRKMKLRQYVYTQKSEDKFIGRMKTLYGDKAIVAYGNWSRTTQMKHFVPTKGVGMRRLISRHFETVLIDEFRTSKLCCNCSKELSHVKVKRGEQGESKKKLYRCLVCEECESSKSEKQRVFLTRDLNSAVNIRRLACDWISNQTRTPGFSRGAPEF